MRQFFQSLKATLHSGLYGQAFQTQHQEALMKTPFSNRHFSKAQVVSH